MTFAKAPHGGVRGPFAWAGLSGAAACAVAALATGLAIARLGPGGLALPLAAIAGAGAVFAPRRAFLALLVVLVAVDATPTGAVTGKLSEALWALPAPLADAAPFKTNPVELYLLFLCGVVLLQRRETAAGAPRLPLLAFAVPLLLVAGAVYGLANGGPANLVYHEARGLIFATVAFVVAWRTGCLAPGTAARVAIAATGLLALLVVARWAGDLRGGGDVPMEFWFAHETGLFLAGGATLGAVLFLHAPRDRTRWALAAFVALEVAAVALTGRRSGILALLVGGAVVAWLEFPKRPLLLGALLVPALIAGAAYLAAFWDAEGVVAEPARAVRSQFDPSERDASSDEYRRIERENLQRTLSTSPLVGVGFGLPFTEYEELPTIEFWPLQTYTPHQNILWLWLKMGIVGAGVFLGLWVVAFRRCLVAARAGASPVLAVAGVVLAAFLLMYLAYARVDLAFVTSRAAVPLAVTIACVLAWLPARAGGGARP